MQNIEYLTERDMKYFEKKEALGEAIIIRIDPEVLLSLDIDAMFQERDKDQTLSVEELEDFLHGKQKEARTGNAAELSEGTVIYGIEENLQNIRLSSDQRQRLIGLINSGASDEELMAVIRENDAKDPTGQKN